MSKSRRKTFLPPPALNLTLEASTSPPCIRLLLTLEQVMRDRIIIAYEAQGVQRAFLEEASFGEEVDAGLSSQNIKEEEFIGIL